MVLVPFNEIILLNIYKHEKRVDGSGVEFLDSVSNHAIYDRHLIISLIKSKIKHSKHYPIDKTNFKNSLKYVKRHPERKFFYVNTKYVKSPIKFTDVLDIQIKCDEYHHKISEKESLCEHILDLLNLHDYSIHNSNFMFLKCLYDNHIVTNSKASKLTRTNITTLPICSNVHKSTINELKDELKYVVDHPERKYLYTDNVYKPINLSSVKDAEQEYQKLERFAKSSIGY